MIGATSTKRYVRCESTVELRYAEGWNDSDEALRKEYLAQSRGENTVAKCMWSGCKKNQLNGSAYCVDHLYANGGTA